MKASQQNFVRLVITRLALSIALMGGWLQIAAADAQQIPGTSVTISPPEGFEPSSQFAGFAHPDSQSSLMIVEMPADAYTELEPLFATEDFAASSMASQGIEVTGIEEIVINDSPTNMIRGTQEAAPGLIAEKFLVLLKGEKTVLVTANILDLETTTAASTVSSLESITLSQPATLEEQLQQLPFTVEVIEPFITNATIAGSTLLLTTFEGTDPSGKQPVIIIANGLQPIVSDDLQAASERLMKETAAEELGDVSIGEGELLTEGQSEAWKIDARSDTKLAIQYLWPRQDDGYIRLVALGEPSQLEPLRPTIEAIARSVASR